jgi:heme/copper-type cytochrome/quinol oxidase subunit 2
MILATLLLHGEDIDLVYFWSSIFMIVLPITIFSTLTYFVLKAYRKRNQAP